MASSTVPPPKDEYPDPADEPRSQATQAAADQWLGREIEISPARPAHGQHEQEQ